MAEQLDKLKAQAVKRVEAAKTQQDLAKMLISFLSRLHNIDASLLLADLMLCSTHDSNKILYKALHEHNIPDEYFAKWSYPDCEEKYWKFSKTVHDAAHYVFNQAHCREHNKTAKEKGYHFYTEEELRVMPYGAKAQKLRELACIIAQMADAFDICDMNIDGYKKE